MGCGPDLTLVADWMLKAYFHTLHGVTPSHLTAMADWPRQPNYFHTLHGVSP